MNTNFRKYLHQQIPALTGYYPVITGNKYHNYNLTISFGPVTVYIEENPYDDTLSVTAMNSDTDEEYHYTIDRHQLYETIGYILDKWFPGG